jgi:type-F conjugative transfer system pilin assembly protein TrbC
LDILSGDGGSAVLCRRLIFGVLMIIFSVPGYANQPYDSELLIFVSFSMPEQSLKLWAEQASRVGCPLLLQGFVDNDLTKTTAKTQSLFGQKANVEISIDPENFQKFNIDVVPAVVIVEPEMAKSETVGLEKEDKDGTLVPYFDVVYGDTALEEALKRIAKSGSLINQKTANQYLKKYRESHE